MLGNKDFLIALPTDWHNLAVIVVTNLTHIFYTSLEILFVLTKDRDPKIR